MFLKDITFNKFWFFISAAADSDIDYHLKCIDHLQNIM